MYKYYDVPVFLADLGTWGYFSNLGIPNEMSVFYSRMDQVKLIMLMQYEEPVVTLSAKCSSFSALQYPDQLETSISQFTLCHEMLFYGGPFFSDIIHFGGFCFAGICKLCSLLA